MHLLFTVFSGCSVTPEGHHQRGKTPSSRLASGTRGAVFPGGGGGDGAWALPPSRCPAPSKPRLRALVGSWPGGSLPGCRAGGELAAGGAAQPVQQLWAVSGPCCRHPSQGVTSSLTSSMRPVLGSASEGPASTTMVAAVGGCSLGPVLGTQHLPRPSDTPMCKLHRCSHQITPTSPLRP